MVLGVVNLQVMHNSVQGEIRPELDEGCPIKALVYFTQCVLGITYECLFASVKYFMFDKGSGKKTGGERGDKARSKRAL